MPSRNAGNLIERRRAPSVCSQPGRSGSAASTWSSDNTAMRPNVPLRDRSQAGHLTEFYSKMVDVRGARDDTIARWRDSAQVIVGGGLLIAVLLVLTVSVVLVSNESEHPLVQVN